MASDRDERRRRAYRDASSAAASAAPLRDGAASDRAATREEARGRKQPVSISHTTQILVVATALCWAVIVALIRWLRD